MGLQWFPVLKKTCEAFESHLSISRGRNRMRGYDFPRVPVSDRMKTSKPRFSSSHFKAKGFSICAEAFSLVVDGPNN